MIRALISVKKWIEFLFVNWMGIYGDWSWWGAIILINYIFQLEDWRAWVIQKIFKKGFFIP